MRTDITEDRITKGIIMNAIYGIIVTGREAKSADDSIVTEKGQKFVATVNHEGWVPATSSHYNDGDTLPCDTKLFESRETAENFAKTWRGDPWWCIPDEFEVVRLSPVTVPRIVGYERGGEK